MRKQTTTGIQASRIVWDNLEEWLQRKVQEFIQSLLEEEITELLGRQNQSDGRQWMFLWPTGMATAKSGR
jgi:hypothetical protein